MPLHRSRDELKSLLLPFVLTAALLVIDQITKAIIVATIERLEYGGPAIEVLGDFFRIIHVRNLGIAFSIGRELGPEIRRVLFIIVPSLVIAALIFYYFRTDELTRLQRWAVAGIVAGGVGNIIDRIFRPEGVVDFLDVKFYGLFGLERWPTFNVADSSVVVCGILLMISVLFEKEHGSMSDEQEG
ncbi:MAG: signal peptidase II [Spirochaetota bacterium]